MPRKLILICAGPVGGACTLDINGPVVQEVLPLQDIFPTEFVCNFNTGKALGARVETIKI
jgi:hypothetical protein